MKNGTSKLKYWHEKYPTRFGVIFLLLYGMLDVADARWFIPLRAKDPCGGCQWVIISTPSKQNESSTEPQVKTSPYMFLKPTIRKEAN